MIRKAYIRNQARKESYLRERRESKKWSDINPDFNLNKFLKQFEKELDYIMPEYKCNIIN